MGIQDIRHKRLLKLLREMGSQAKLAEASGYAPAYINQLLQRKRSIGEKTARKIESILGKEHNWLDKDSSVNYESTELKEAINILRRLPEDDLSKVLYLLRAFDPIDHPTMSAKDHERANSF